MTAVYIILIIASVIMLLSLIPINVIADFAYNYSDNSLYLKFLFFKVKLFPSEKKSEHEKNKEEKTSEKEENTSKEKADTTDTLKKIWRVYQALKEDVFGLVNYIFTKALTIRELNISEECGTGNPMYTGILCGAVNAAVYGFLGTAEAKMKIKNHNINLQFDFDNVKLKAGVYTVIYTRAVYVYCIAVKALVILMKLLKTLKEVKKDEQSCK